MARLTSSSIPAKQQTFGADDTHKTQKRKRPEKTRVDSRFKFSSAASQSKRIKVNLANVVASFALESDLKEGCGGHFYAALEHSAIENLSIPFTKFYGVIEPKSRSLPLLLHHKESIVEACCAALIIQIEEDNVVLQSRELQFKSLQARKNHQVQAEKQQKRKLLKAREAIDLVASTVLDLLTPLIVDLSTSLLEPSLTLNNPTCFERILTTLLYFINLPNPEPVALEKATQIIVHLFKTLAKELGSTHDGDGEVGESKLAKIWELTRGALGAPPTLPSKQENCELYHSSCESTEDLDRVRQEEAFEIDEDARPELDDDGADDLEPANELSFTNPAQELDVDEANVADVDPDDFSATADDLPDPIALPPTPNPSLPTQSYLEPLKNVLNTTSPSTRKILATSLAFLLRKKDCSSALIEMMVKDLSAVESYEGSSKAGLRPRKEQNQADRRGGKKNVLGEERGCARVFAEGICWTVAESCKTIDRRLHSRSGEIIASLQSCVEKTALEVQTEVSLTIGVLQASLIALLHHSTAEHFESVLSHILNKAKESLKWLQVGSAGVELDQLIQELYISLHCLSVVAGVRQGSKISESQKGEMFKILYNLLTLLSNKNPNFPLHLYPVTSAYFVNLLASIKSTGELLAAAEVRKSIECLLCPDGMVLPLRYIYSTCAALCRLKWAFMDDFMIPGLWPFLQSHLQQPPCDAITQDLHSGMTTASLLVHVTACVGKKQSVPNTSLDAVVCKVDWAMKTILDHMCHCLTASGSTSTESSHQLLRETSDWIQVFVHVASEREHRQYLQTHAALIDEWTRSIEGFVLRILAENDVDALRNQYLDDYRSGRPLNQTMLISQIINLFRFLIMINDASKARNGILQQIPRLIELWGWHKNFLREASGLCHDVRHSRPADVLPSFNAIYQHLKAALLSENSSIRSEALRILESFNRDPNLGKIIGQCVLIEETPLLVEHARDRQMHIRKLSIMVKSDLKLNEESDSVDIAQRYILSQLKVHFKPLWEESIKALTLLNERFSTSFWSLVWNQLEMVLHDSQDIQWCPATQFDGASSSKKRDGVVCTFSNEGQLMCTNLNALEKLRVEEIGIEQARWIGDAQKLECRLDLRNYEIQLLDLLCHNPVVAQKHNKDIINAYFKFCQPNEDDIDQGHTLGKSARTRLVNWLPLLSRFHNPKTLFRSQELRESFYGILADPDPALRALALECVLTWKDGGLVRHQEHLRDLLDSSKFRDTLLKFSLASEDGERVSDGDRADVMPVAIRILYGCMLMSGGRGCTAQSQAPRRSAILSALKSCSAKELDLLVDLMLRPLESSSSSKTTASVKKQLGFLVLLGDVIKAMGKDLCSRWPELLNAVMGLMTTAQLTLESAIEDQTELDGSPIAQYKKMRTQAIHRLTSFFRHAPSTFSFQAWIDPIFTIVVQPRLANFAFESAQAPSALLELFRTWSSRQEHLLLLVDHDQSILAEVYKTLAVPNVKPQVIDRTLDVLENILRCIDDSRAEYSSQRLLTSYFGVLLPNLAELLRRTSMLATLHSTTAGRRQVNLLSSLVPYINETEHAESFCKLILPLLSKRNQRIPVAIQTDLITILSDFLEKAPQISRLSTTLQTLSSLLETVSSRRGRLALVKALRAVSIHCEELRENVVVRLVGELNSFSSKRLDEPDFEKRLNAFSEINESLHMSFGALEWEILIYHTLYQIRDEEELSLRSSSAFLITRFLDAVAGNAEHTNLRLVLTKVLMPGLKKALRSKAEIIRQDVLTVLSAATEKDLPDVPELREMKCLLVNGDKEANFFLNVYHIQSHRRTRALRRLADEAESGRLSSKVLLDIFCPLLVHTLAPKSASKVDPEVVNEAVRTIGRVVKVLSWSAYNAILQFYMKLVHSPETLNKTIVRVVVSVLRNFHFNLIAADSSTLMPAPAHAAEDLSGRLIPKLIRFMEQQKEGGADESLRIMMSEGVAVVATFLPSPAKPLAIAGVVSSLSQILKSTHQETRQSARSTMANIAFLLPKECLVVVIKELRSALLRGPQVHVLAHAIFAILTRTAEWPDVELPQEAVTPLMNVLIEDLFGEPAKERQSKELRAKTKFVETRSSRSLESLQMLVSRLSNSAQLTDLLRPFRNVLESTRSARALKQLEECFRRLTAGIVSNSRHFDAPIVLKLVHTLISRNSDLLKDQSQKKPRKIIKPTDHQLVLTDKNQNHVDYYEENAHYFVSLGLDLFQALYRKGDFDLHEPSNLELIDPLVNMVGNTLYSHNSEVLGRGLRVMGILIKLPLGSVEKSANAIVRQMLSVVSNMGSSESELSQIALKTLASVIRDCKLVELTEKQLTALLKMISPDLEDPSRQTTLFVLLRGIMAKKFLAPELYDLMDRLAHVLVTAQARQVREVCRAIYLQFLLDYPQGKGRMTNSMEFLVKNLSYEHESGRESVLEILNAITSKIRAELVGKFADLWFMSLVMAVANEESTRCKEMALEVVKVVFRRVQSSKASEFMEMLFAWHQGKETQTGLKQTALQLLTVYTEIRATDDYASLHRIHRLLLSTAKSIAEKLLVAEKEEDLESSLDWQLAYQTLQGLSKVFKIAPDRIGVGMKDDEWVSIQDLLLFPHVWVRNSAARLIGIRFSSPGVPPFQTDQLIKIARQSSLQLRSEKLDETLALQIVKNIFFVLKTLRDRVSDGQNLQSIVGIGRGHGLEDEGADEMSDSDDEHQNSKKLCPGAELIKMVRRLSRQANLAHAKRPSIFASVDGRRWSLEPISVLRCFAALINHLSIDDLDALLHPLMIPIYRIIEDANIKDSQMVDLQNLANEVQEFLREKVGTTKFSAAYQRLRTRAMEKRQQRKTIEALKAINHPEALAKRKASRGEAKHRNKKRKQENFAQKKLAYGK